MRFLVLLVKQKTIFCPTNIVLKTIFLHNKLLFIAKNPGSNYPAVNRNFYRHLSMDNPLI